MLHDIHKVIRRSETLAADMAGAAALVVMLVGALHLPVLF